MDPRRLLVCAAAAALGGCALLPPLPSPPFPRPAPSPPPVLVLPGPAPEPAAPPIETAGPGPDPAEPTELAAAPAAGEGGRRAIAAANAAARAVSRADAFVGGVQVFAFAPGRVYEVWTAPLRVTALTLAPGETVSAKAAGDTVRWRIGESVSGAGATARTHVLVKPLEAGLETNLVLTTSRRVYLIQLRSGDAAAFNPAVAWDAWDAGAAGAAPAAADPAPPVQGPVNARYRIEAGRRPPPWTPTAVFDDGTRTYVVLAPEAGRGEIPALFALVDGEAQLVNYRQAGGLLIADRLFDRAELRLGGRRPQTVRISRRGEGGR